MAHGTEAFKAAMNEATPYSNWLKKLDAQFSSSTTSSDRQPDYWDFLYFSFVIGMTSQVSDVAISSRPLIRLALVHGILSFFFSTAILAMSINIIAGMI